MNKSLTMILISLGLFFLGCVSQPAPMPKTEIIDPGGYYNQVRELTTTKEDIEALLGKPNHTSTRSMAGGQCETWWYLSPNFGLIFTFNQNGIVISKQEQVFSDGHSTMRNTDHCIFRNHSGKICGQPAIILDPQRGPLCVNHAVKQETKEIGSERGKRTQSGHAEEDQP